MWALRGAREEAGSWSFWCRFCEWRVTRAAAAQLSGAMRGVETSPMDDGTTALPWTHGVNLYAHDAELVGSLERYLLPAWSSGGVGLVIATRAHRRQLRLRLAERKLEESLGEGRFVELDTDDTLRLFMRDGSPDRLLFHDTVGSLVRELAGERPLNAFGEMVDVLWTQGNPEGALSLERLWGELQQDVEFALLCGYAHAGVDAAGRAAITEAHDHVEVRDLSWGC